MKHDCVRVIGLSDSLNGVVSSDECFPQNGISSSDGRMLRSEVYVEDVDMKMETQGRI